MLNKRSKTAIIILLFCEMLFLMRAFVLYSFYTHDAMYGDGQPEIGQYNRELLKLVVYSLCVTFALICCSIFIFRKPLKNKP